MIKLKLNPGKWCLGIFFLALLVSVCMTDIAQAATKKGIQGTEFLQAEAVGEDLGVSHVLLNIDAAEFISTTKSDGAQESVTVNGTTYYFSSNIHYQLAVQELNQKGITVTAVLLMSWSSDPKVRGLLYPAARQPGHLYYSLNGTDAGAEKVLSAYFQYMIGTLSTPDHHIDNWILGNEVNMPEVYNYSGSANIIENVCLYAKNFSVMYNAMRQAGTANAKAYISLDHCWNYGEGGFPGKFFLDLFAVEIAQRYGNVKWNIAYHPYAPIMDSTGGTETRAWFNHFTTNSLDTLFISAANLSVLTEYVKSTYGFDKRILLSEFGFDARANDSEQAAYFAYSYKAAERNDMIDAAIYRGYTDTGSDQGLRLGILSGDMTAFSKALSKGTVSGRDYIMAHKRRAYNVFKYMDKSNSGAYINKYLSFIGIKNWTDPVTVEVGWDLSPVDYQTVYHGVDYRAVYNYHYYLWRYPELPNYFGYDQNAILGHFVQYGMSEGRQAKAEFNVYQYRDNYADTKAAFGNDLALYYYHYIHHGKSEKRNGYCRTYINSADWVSRDAEAVNLYGRGDVNKDGTVDLKDAQLTLRAALNLELLPEEGREMADVNQNQAVEIRDALLILKSVLNIGY